MKLRALATAVFFLTTASFANADDVVCDGCVNGVDISNRAVISRHIRKGAVGNLAVEDGAIDWQKLAASLQQRITSLEETVDALAERQRCHTRPGDLQVDENGTYAGGVDWRGCDKTGLQMWGPASGGAETEVLTNADLRHVDFTLASILGVSMGGANLEGAVFKNANLGGSDLSDANIIGPDGVLYGQAPTVFINTNCPDGTNSDDVGGTCANNRIP